MNQNKIKTETIIRTVVLAVAIINQILAIAGKDTLPLYESDIAQFVSIFALICSTLWAWWKNNSFSHNAIKADDYKQHLDELEEMEK
ncbi:MAG: phage holin [Ruminococcaceae bacterium]|nr:phage holin [Oscillospiraceae bacterium]